MPPLWWAALVFGVAYVGVVVAEKQGWIRAIKVVPALLLAALFVGQPLMAAGMVASAAGDAFLLDKKRYFLQGLVSFLVGHVCFIAAFLTTSGVWPTPVVVGSILVLAIGMVGVLMPKAGVLRFAVPVYGLTLGAMAMAASTLGALALVGALTFMVSDAFLAFTLFKRPVHRGDVVVMVTYYGALLTLAAAALGTAGR